MTYIKLKERAPEGHISIAKIRIVAWSMKAAKGMLSSVATRRSANYLTAKKWYV